MDIEQAIRDNINKTFHLSLGTSKDNQPWVCEVHFAYDDRLNLYFRSTTKRRHSQEIAANPRVAGNIVRQHALDEQPLGIYFEGKARRLESAEEKQRAFACLQSRLDVSDEVLAESNNEEGHQFYQITVETFYVFGALGDKGLSKHTLAWNGGQQ